MIPLSKPLGMRVYNINANIAGNVTTNPYSPEPGWPEVVDIRWENGNVTPINVMSKSVVPFSEAMSGRIESPLLSRVRTLHWLSRYAGITPLHYIKLIVEQAARAGSETVICKGKVINVIHKGNRTFTIIMSDHNR